MPVLDDVCKVYYPHLNKENILEKARKGDFPFKCVQIFNLDKINKFMYTFMYTKLINKLKTTWNTMQWAKR
jgi:hypothetical protein